MKKLDIKDVKSLLVMVTGFCVISLILRSRDSLIASNIFFYLAIFIGVISVLIPVVGSFIVWLWYKIALILGWINSRIILTALFFLFLFPISLIYRLFNKDPMKIKKAIPNSMFIERNHQYEAKDFENMW